MSCQPSHPAGVSISYGLGNADVFAGAAMCSPPSGLTLYTTIAPTPKGRVVTPDPEAGTAEREPTMRAVRQHSLGGPDVLELVDVPRPVAASTEVRVRVAAAGVNPVDWKTRT